MRHWQECHNPEVPPKYSFHLLGRNKTALDRQINEALAIEKTKCDTIHNGKGEWGINLIPRLQTSNFEPTPHPESKTSKSSSSKRDSHGFTTYIQRSNTCESPQVQTQQSYFCAQFRQRKRRRLASSMNDSIESPHMLDQLTPMAAQSEMVLHGQPQNFLNQI